MKGINRVTLLGNIGKEPDLKTLDNGTPVAKLTLATTETYRLKDGSSKTHTDWHNIIVWRGLATFVSKYLHKGSLVYVEGKIKYRQYADKEGNKKYVTEIVADQLLLLDKKSEGTQARSNEEDGNNEDLPF